MQPIKIWCLLRDQFGHVQPVESAFKQEAEFIFDEIWDPNHLVSSHPDIVLCVNDYYYDVVRCLDEARKAGIPSLVLQDGILEWRCQYSNPLFGAGDGAPQHQPVMSDKIATIGHQSARLIAGWGNADKVEITGMPRMDYLLSHQTGRIRTPGSRLLVMTAKNPGFTLEQRETTLRSLQDTKAFLETLPGVEVGWRVSRGLASALGVENQLEKISSLELVKVLEGVDAVISTPSTAVLEAMLLGRPVAALDYPNSPRFLQTAWTISAKEHLAAVVPELLNPSATKLAFQRDCLADSLECDGPAAQRVCSLIRQMIAIAKEARRTGREPGFPADMLASTGSFHTFKMPPLGVMYEGHSVFQENNQTTLQLRLARAENENRILKTENAELKKRMQFGSWLRHGVRQLANNVSGSR
ncbi:hypothetical protein [Pedosphaera parvula]|uniref:Uncharacterized protein n=1 Tax=Pedosphaera parvula (strain Ellin514) TaxID=320771 RepID=B9XAX6_PEDPL|nr:hypothetical protein [Pedosphaera parvula]EEF63161.1 hypothetical protein Cflav_PD5796 [Pedosphaera parvula Ellin514]